MFKALQRTASLKGATFTRQFCYHILIHSGLRPVALRLILSDDLPLSSYENVCSKTGKRKKDAKTFFNPFFYKLDCNFKPLDRILLTGSEPLTYSDYIFTHFDNRAIATF